MMWPDKDDAAGRNNLRATLTHLRTLIEHTDDSRSDDDASPPWHLRSDGDSLELFVSDRLVIDADEFDDAIRAARRADSERNPAETLRHCQFAIARWAGPYLADAADPDRAFDQRMSRLLDMVWALIRASELCAGRGDHDDALDLARRAIEIEPLSERAHRIAIQTLLSSGDRPGARRAADRCIELLAADGLTPEPETLRLRASLT